VKEVEKHIESIIIRKISSDISADDEKFLAAWIEESQENKDYYQDLKKIYSAAKADTAAAQYINIDAEWSRFKQNVDPQRTERTYRTSWIRIAASIIIITTLGYAFWSRNSQPEDISILAKNSGQVIILPDNSTVTLNKGATLTYPKKFNDKERLLFLEGEAFFEVTRNTKKTFKVELNQGVVEVLGTSFNINTKNNDNQIEVVVVTGKVKLANSANENFLILIKGEKGLIMKTNNLIAKANNDDVNFMAWKTRKIVFNDMELDEVIHTLNSLYDSNISFLTEVGKNCKVTVSFDNQSIEAILSVLELTHDLEYKKSGDLIEIVKSGC